MDTIELRAAAARLLNLHERFAPCFGRRECQEHSLGYLRGLLLADGRKSVEPMALLFGGPSDEQPNIDQNIALAWQRFLTVSPWEARDVQQEIRAVFNEEFGRDGDFLDAMKQRQQRYLVEVPADTTVWAEKPLGIDAPRAAWAFSIRR